MSTVLKSYLLAIAFLGSPRLNSSVYQSLYLMRFLNASIFVAWIWSRLKILALTQLS